LVAEEHLDGRRASPGSQSLEDVFARVTRQVDYTCVAKEILQVVRS